MFKITNNIITREPVPAFLVGLTQETLRDLSWTDPQLEVSDCVWWPEQDMSPPLGPYEVYGAETTTLGDNVVIVTREVLPMTEEQRNNVTAEELSRNQVTRLRAQLDNLE